MSTAPKATCLLCNNTIQSQHRHDFKWCSCKNIFVDGGEDYFRFGYNSDKYVIEYTKQEKEDEETSS